MAYTVDYSIFEAIFEQGSIWEFGFILPLLLSIITMLLITRDTENWKTMFLPVLVVLWIIGLPVNMLLFVVASILFVFSLMGAKTFSQVLQGRRSDLKEEKDMKERVRIGLLRKKVESLGKYDPVKLAKKPSFLKKSLTSLRAKTKESIEKAKKRKVEKKILKANKKYLIKPAHSKGELDKLALGDMFEKKKRKYKLE